MTLGLVLFFTLLMSWSATWLLRRYALNRSLMDVPNARSSHSVPTPRGGGVAIVVSFLFVLLALVDVGYGEASVTVAYVGTGLLVAFIGFADDHGHIAARWRLLGHFLGAGWGVFWLKGMGGLATPWGELQLGLLGAVLATVYVVWMLNLYNFMDGIDGLASVQAISVCLGASALYGLTNHAELLYAPLLLASAVAGFLLWNFPPAKIFMGDAGSGFLGCTLALLSLVGGWADPRFLFCWLILMGVFVVDATWTLMHRLLRGERIYEAHRSHAYQYASRRFGSHKKVTAAVAALNVCWLTPLALAVGAGWVGGVAALLVAYLPLCVLAWYFRAGSAEVIVTGAEL